MSNSVRPHRRQPTRPRHPWDSPGRNTGVGCHFLLQCMKVKSESEVAQLCLTLRNPMDCSPPGSSVRGIFQARVIWYISTYFLVQSGKPIKFRGVYIYIYIFFFFCTWMYNYSSSNCWKPVISTELALMLVSKIIYLREPISWWLNLFQKPVPVLLPKFHSLEHQAFKINCGIQS